MRFLRCVFFLVAASAILQAQSVDDKVTVTVTHDLDAERPAETLQFSVRMADSEIARLGDKLAWKPGGKWDYAANVFALSLLKLADRTQSPRYTEFVKDSIGSWVTPEGELQGWKSGDYNIDNLNGGKVLLELFHRTGEDRYRRASDALRAQLRDHPRTSEGGFWHKQRYTDQMWLDGLYMGAPFYAAYAQAFGEKEAFDDIAKQFRLIAAHAYDARTGLFYHGWDEAKAQNWASRETGTSASFWSRGIGWLAMALVDTLGYFPPDHPARPELIGLLNKTARGVIKYQDPASGLWWQVTDQGSRPGNYLEATASSMFVYALAKGVNAGYLPPEFAEAARRGYAGLIRDLVKPDAEGRLNLTQCCQVAGLGQPDRRDGTFAYYVSEPIVENDLKGVGPFILAGIELEKLSASQQVSGNIDRDTPAKPPEGEGSPGPWIPDQGDGTYRNPVLFADYSDPDAIRVGSDYWLTASSFSHVPGLPILHSEDLVNWTLVNHALPALVPRDHFALPRHGAGVWAPAIRHHAGKFWIFYPDPDFGIYVVTADDPRGKWSEPVLVKAGKGLIDPCPFWDEDGQAYLIHGWAKSRSGISNQLTLHRLKPDGTAVLDEGKVIIDANKLEGWRTLEGPKLYKRDGYYWVFAPAGGVAEGYQAVFRSREIWGPYEHRIVLDQGSTPVNGPHQGAWVTTQDGNWFLHFQEMPAYGRVVHLQPMQWRADGWPVMGNDVGGGGKGEPVLVHKKPLDAGQSAAAPATTDEFDGLRMGLQWQWQANPRSEWSSLAARPGWLRLQCTPLASGNSLWNAAHLLMQKFAAPAFVATTRLQFSPRREGETAGLVVFGYDYAWLVLRKAGDRQRIVLVTCSDAHNGGIEKEVASGDVKAGGIFLRVSVGEGARCRFAWSEDGKRFSPIGGEFQAKSSRWVGAKVGVFASAPPGAADSGYADFDWFRVTSR